MAAAAVARAEVARLKRRLEVQRRNVPITRSVKVDGKIPALISLYPAELGLVQSSSNRSRCGTSAHPRSRICGCISEENFVALLQRVWIRLLGGGLEPVDVVACAVGSEHANWIIKTTVYRTAAYCSLILSFARP